MAAKLVNDRRRGHADVSANASWFARVGRRPIFPAGH
jgi:hypothetical protein